MGLIGWHTSRQVLPLTDGESVQLVHVQVRR